MKILIVEGNASSSAGGAESSMRTFCEFLAMEHTLFMACTNKGDYVVNPALNQIYAETVKVELPPPTLRTILTWQKDLICLARFVRRNSIELIVSHVVHATPVLRCVSALTGRPYALYYKWICSFDDVGSKVRWGNNGIINAAANSQYIADYWSKNSVAADNITVVPEGVQHQPRRTEYRSAGQFTLGFAGRIVPEKGLDDLLQTIAILRERGIDVLLRVAGRFHGSDSDLPNSYHVNIENEIRRLGIDALVQFDGFVYPLEDWFPGVDVVVVPSTCQDAQPLVMMQAIATGTPVVASRVGGIPEVLGGEFSRLLFSANAPHEAADLIQKLADDRASLAVIGEKLYRHAHGNYSINAHFQQLSAAIGVRAAG